MSVPRSEWRVFAAETLPTLKQPSSNADARLVSGRTRRAFGGTRPCRRSRFLLLLLVNRRTVGPKPSRPLISHSGQRTSHQRRTRCSTEVTPPIHRRSACFCLRVTSSDVRRGFSDCRNFLGDESDAAAIECRRPDNSGHHRVLSTTVAPHSRVQRDCEAAAMSRGSC